MVFEKIQEFKEKLKKYQNVVQIDSCDQAVIISNMEGFEDAEVSEENENIYKYNKVKLEIAERRTWLQATIKSILYSHLHILNFVQKWQEPNKELRS